MAIVGLLPDNARVRGRIEFVGANIAQLSDAQMNEIRGRHIGVVFQDPARALNPVFTVGYQIVEVLERHLPLSRRQAVARAADLLVEVGISDPELRLQQYPHELSGGLKQRVMIAMAIACEPQLLIADEPTTALDVTIQRQVLKLLRRLSIQRNLSLVLVTHDFGVVAAMADEVAVMYAGRIVERGDVVDVFHSPKHPYTQALLAANPRRILDADDRTLKLEPIAGAPPSPAERSEGCDFAPRCRYRKPECDTVPALTGKLQHSVACWAATEAGARD